MTGESVSPAEAAEQLSANQEAVYLDVRSEPEFLRGHPVGALNVPILFLQPGAPPSPNPDFVDVVEANIPKDKPVYVGCGSGERSAQAVRLLQAQAYEQVINVDCGYSGKRDPMGNVIAPGWLQLELPSDSGDGGERSYASLRARLEAD